MQQPEKTASETKTQGNGCLGLEGKGGVIQAKFAHALLEFLVIRSVDRVKSAENHRTNLLVAREHLLGCGLGKGEGIPDFDLGYVANARYHVTDLPLDERFVRNRLGAELSKFLDLSFPRVAHQDKTSVLGELPRKHTNIANHPLECVELVIEDQGPRFRMLGPPWWRQTMNHRLENLVYPNARLSTCLDGIFGGNGKDVLDLLGHPINVGARQVHLVDHGYDIQSLGIRKLCVGQSLSLDSLRRIDQKQGAFASRKTSGNFIGEINVTGRVDQVEQVFFSILGQIGHRNRMTLDGNSAFAL